jgi:hypothetical protein
MLLLYPVRFRDPVTDTHRQRSLHCGGVGARRIAAPVQLNWLLPITVLAPAQMFGTLQE